MKRISVAIASVAGAAMLLAAAALTSSTRTPPPVAVAAVPHVSASFFGVYEPGVPASYSPVIDFASQVHRSPQVVVYYSSWYEPFATAFARSAHAAGATVLVQVNPSGISLPDITAGHYDSYLHSYASDVRAFGSPVILSFGHEMNGTWYHWGTGHTTPAQFITAWQHIVTLFRANGALNVTWLWDVNCALPGSSPVSEWWPGQAYVNWTGINCYFTRPGDTFYSLIGPTLAAVRKVTSEPVMIAETANGPDSGSSRAAQLAGMFKAVRANHLLGLVWFDQKQDQGSYHQDWRLEDDPQALIAFRAALARY